MKNINILTVGLLFTLVITIVVAINAYSKVNDEKDELENELAAYQTSVLLEHDLFSQTKKYLEALMTGDASDFLSERYLEEIESLEEQEDNHEHSRAKLENMEIYNISVDPQSTDEFLVYVIYYAQMGGIENEEVEGYQYRSMISTTKLTFIKENGEYKVDKSELKPIDTSESFFEDLMR